MQQKNYLFFLLTAVVLLSACKKDEKLEPSALTIQYKLPQGDHDFDNDLVALNRDYGTFFLYKFTVDDFSWVQTEPGTLPSTWFRNRYACDTAEAAYTGMVLNFIKKNWLHFYPDAFLKEQLPFKVLLAKNLRSLPSTKLNTLTGFNHITINNFSADFDLLTPAQKLTFRNDIHNEFWNWMLVNNKVVLPADFLSVSNYTQAGVTAANMYSYGFLLPNMSSLDKKEFSDIMAYLRAITRNTRAQLDATILSPTNDTKGLVKKKYDFITNFYKTKYNVDLQLIGETGLIP